MAGSVNKVILVGNLGADPESRQVGDSTVCNLSVATSESWTGKDGQKQEKTEWHRVNVWGPQAEACAKYLAKGRKVYVEGQIQTRKYAKDGVDHYATEIRASNVVFIDSGDQGGNRQGGGQQGNRGSQGGGNRGGGGGGNQSGGGGHGGGGDW